MLPTLDRSVDATPSELQSDYRRLLDLAQKGAVVNIRQRGGKPPITLISNETWNDAILAKAWLSLLSGVVKYAVGRILQHEPNVCPAEFSWLQLYNNTHDIRKFIDELSGAIIAAVAGTRSWDDVNAVVDEWSRSAALLENEELIDRFRKAKENK